MITSASLSLPVTTSRNASAFTSTTAFIQPHFISLPQPQTLADRISLRYTMPWQAMIISCGSQICSGSILSSSWVLTAAHCVRNMNPEDTIVILGLRHPGAPLRIVKVTTILLHERFRLVSGTARNDLALVLLQESQNSIQISAPLGHLKNLNNSECWLSGPQILKPGETDENPEVLQMQVMGASNCAHLYPDIGSSIICFITHAKGHDTNMEPVNPGSAVMCRPIYGNGKWRQIGLTSLKALATIISPHFSWIISTTEKAGHPLNQAAMPWMEKANSSCLLKYTTKLFLSLHPALPSPLLPPYTTPSAKITVCAIRLVFVFIVNVYSVSRTCISVMPDHLHSVWACQRDLTLLFCDDPTHDMWKLYCPAC
ncbi:serine protease 52-like [Dipodomys spectabilis]|uniref:serine protease 52-like n=1 Tax=Dipodomys spectabilis TaxID=105255 RepID=UPI001C5434C4|nr:serine protease 52-like [Dipodomys spectabilis]